MTGTKISQGVMQPIAVLSPAGANATNMKLNDRKPAQLWVVCLSPSARGFLKFKAPHGRNAKLSPLSRVVNSRAKHRRESKGTEVRDSQSDWMQCCLTLNDNDNVTGGLVPCGVPGDVPHRVRSHFEIPEPLSNQLDGDALFPDDVCPMRKIAY